MIIRSKAPLRLGLAGGGTDVSPYCELYGGAILNATIDLFAYATIEPLNSGKIIIESIDQKKKFEYKSEIKLPNDKGLELIHEVYNKLVQKYLQKPLSFKLSTFIDVPAGSGLGGSSTLVVALIGAFKKWHQLALSDFDIAQLAFEIERTDMKMAGGRQDQYSAAFGGVNFMEFFSDNKVVVNPLNIKPEHLTKLSENLLLYYTETSRFSSEIIESQMKNIIQNDPTSIEATHCLKEQVFLMKGALSEGNLNEVGIILRHGWENKKKLTNGISNPYLDKIYETAIRNGATGGKISGAGGGGFMMFYCPDGTKNKVIASLKPFGGFEKKYAFTQSGLTTWVEN